MRRRGNTQKGRRKEISLDSNPPPPCCSHIESKNKIVCEAKLLGGEGRDILHAERSNEVSQKIARKRLPFRERRSLRRISGSLSKHKRAWIENVLSPRSLSPRSSHLDESESITYDRGFSIDLYFLSKGLSPRSKAPDREQHLSRQISLPTADSPQLPHLSRKECSTRAQTSQAALNTDLTMRGKKRSRGLANKICPKHEHKKRRRGLSFL